MKAWSEVAITTGFTAPLAYITNEDRSAWEENAMGPDSFVEVDTATGIAYTGHLGSSAVSRRTGGPMSASAQSQIAFMKNLSRLIAAGVDEARAWDIALQAQQAGQDVARKAAGK